jgi:hypothetical protein
LARAKELIFNATREQLKAAYDECMKTGADYTELYIIEEMFKRIGNRAPNPENGMNIDFIQFEDIRR